MSYEDYVCGTRFQALADVVIGQHGKEEWKDPALREWAGMANKEVRRIIVYCHTHDFRYVVDRIAKLHHSVTLITHNSDGAVRSSLENQTMGENDADTNLLPSNVVRWYAQNVEATPNLFDNKLIPLPIGLENRYCFPYDKAEMLFAKDVNTPSKGLSYFNCNLRTNLSERTRALEACQLAREHGKVSIRLGQNGDDYNSYLDDILAHKAVISPRGNGLDCHRTWEALYLKRVPIMKWTPSLATFNLPIIWIRTWDQIAFSSKKSIETSVDFYLSEINSGKADMRALSMKYWKERIENAR